MAHETQKKSFLQGRLFLGMAIPLIIYYILKRYYSLTITCTVISIYTLLYTLYDLKKKKSLNLFSILAFILSTISVLGMMILKDDRFYWIQGIIENILFAAVFLISLMWNRSAMQMLAEDSGVGHLPSVIRELKFYKNLWRFETKAWIGYYVFLALSKTFIYLNFTKDTYMMFSVIFGSYGIPALIALSIFYAKSQFSKYDFEAAIKAEQTRRVA